MKLRKILSVILSVIVLFGTLPFGTFTVSAAKSGTTGDCIWSLGGTVLTISGNGAMQDYDYFNPSPWGTSITKVVIENGVTSIGNNAFAHCGSLTGITIPDSVTSIGVYAILNCTSLTDITIPNNVTSIGNGAFSGCSSLRNIKIPDSVTSIGDRAFFGCYLLKSIKIPSGVTSIGEQTFSDCTDLSSIIIPKSVTSIDDWAFAYCTQLKDVYFEGTAEEWQAINILDHNTYLINATVYYNSTGNSISSVGITKLPDKLTYIENEEQLDLTGGVLTVNYINGDTLEIDLATLNAEGFDNSVLGKQTLTVKYGEYIAEFEVEIIIIPIAFMAVSCMPEKTKYLVGDSLDLTGGKIAVGYPEGNYEIFDLTYDMVSGYDASKTGKQILTVTYKGYTDQLIIEVFGKTDLNCDGKANAMDLIIIKKALSGATGIDVSYDVNGDGAVNIKDLVNIKKQIADA